MTRILMLLLRYLLPGRRAKAHPPPPPKPEPPVDFAKVLSELDGLLIDANTVAQAIGVNTVVIAQWANSDPVTPEAQRRCGGPLQLTLDCANYLDRNPIPGLDTDAALRTVLPDIQAGNWPFSLRTSDSSSGESGGPAANHRRTA